MLGCDDNSLRKPISISLSLQIANAYPKAPSKVASHAMLKLRRLSPLPLPGLQLLKGLLDVFLPFHFGVGHDLDFAIAPVNRRELLRYSIEEDIMRKQRIPMYEVLDGRRHGFNASRNHSGLVI